VDLAATLDFVKTYFELGPDGRRWARARRKSDAHNPHRLHIALLENADDRRELLRKLIICDQAFEVCIPAVLPPGFARSRDDLYARMVPFAMVNLLIRCRLLDAYGISYDRTAELRLAMLMLFQREWNDVGDTHDRIAALNAADSEKEPEPAFFLLWHISQHGQKLAPIEGHPDFIDLYAFLKQRLPQIDPKDTSEPLFARIAAFSLKTGYATMFPRIPERLGRVIPLFAQWFYSLDELSDYRRDKAARKPTYFSTLTDPVAEMKRVVAACEALVREEAPAPDRILSLIRYVTQEILKAHATGLDLEHEIFGAPSASS